MVDRELTIPTTTTVLPGRLSLPDRPLGLLVLAHGGDEERDAHHRDAGLADALCGREFGVVTLELLSGMHGQQAASPERHAMHVLTQRLVSTCDWLNSWPTTSGLPIGLFGVDLGAGAALCAAAARPERVAAVVTWQGHLDLVGGDLLARVRAPTLMLVGERDPEHLVAAEAACAHLLVTHGIKVVTAHSMFRERATDEVARAAHAFFSNHLHGERRAAASFEDDGARGV